MWELVGSFEDSTKDRCHDQKKSGYGKLEDSSYCGPKK